MANPRTCWGFRDHREMVKWVVALEQWLGVECSVHPVVQVFGRASVKQKHPHKALHVPSGHRAKPWEPWVGGRHKQQLQHYVIIPAQFYQESPHNDQEHDCIIGILFNLTWGYFSISTAKILSASLISHDSGSLVTHTCISRKTFYLTNSKTNK